MLRKLRHQQRNLVQSIGNYSQKNCKLQIKRNSDTETQHRLNKYKKKCIPKHISKVVESRSQVSVKLSMSESIEKFHKNIGIGPEYICTCCEQLWYKSSVTKCNPDLYKSCSQETLNLCISSLTSSSAVQHVSLCLCSLLAATSQFSIPIGQKMQLTG